MDTYVEILDVLSHDLYRNPADINVIPIHFSIHPDSPPVQEAYQHQGHNHSILPELPLQ